MIRGIESRKKRYVEVDVTIDVNGKYIPRAITWDDEQKYEIDKVLDVRQAASLKVGGNGVRYFVRVGETETFLFQENPRWFVEEKVFEPYQEYDDYGNYGKR